jgi:hypothetical protein
VLNRNPLPTDLPGRDLGYDRAGMCKLRYESPQHKGMYEGEYEKLAAAFKQLILDPYVDPDLLKKVMATDWLKNP